mmetsp:Transcript_4955/g.9855  ORF Transcript_4955/g.9855 Transcript_4955/m.9855 type:complete len:635 (-) Transcript_4955:450-2354(-)|eukprot:CAMPEP_0181291484 /NCGR_PEP_ID=MMETSP1101-20121128/1991_1 /TAXON_ID=46948 /ORGANISM="Rhodomonas abbreviata, Strain Caron Lab Isolate" /LENGTH=634 /DNA_ID=CAMNT_0023395877 /DNA_START=45 /DNA_END=1949 /DNA_ORIENTATION=+
MSTGRRRRRGDGDDEQSPREAQRARLSDVILEKILNSTSWQELFGVDQSVSAGDDERYADALASRRRLLIVAHPDKASSTADFDRANAATAKLNERWTEARNFFEQESAPSQQPLRSATGRTGSTSNRPPSQPPLHSATGDASSRASLGIGVPPSEPDHREDSPVFEEVPLGALFVLNQAACAQPPTLLKHKDVFVGFGTTTLLKTCRFLPMSTNRCISQEVVAERVTQNLARLRRFGEYYDFGQISVVAVRTPNSEQYVDEVHLQNNADGSVTSISQRFARFYVLDGQHRLMTMTDLQEQKPNVPISFEISVKVVNSKQEANEALLHMQRTYRPNPKCFFLLDNEAAVAGHVLDLAKLKWPHAFISEHNQSFSSSVKRVNRPDMDDGLFFDVLRDTHLLRKAVSKFHSFLDVEYAGHSYSSVFAGDTVGAGHGCGRMDSSQAWSAGQNNAGEWMKLDLGSVQQVAGIITLPRARSSQRVTGYRVEVSTDGKAWDSVDDRCVFDGNAPQASPDCREVVRFSHLYTARFVKIVVQSWHEHISMRAGVLIPDPTKNQIRAEELMNNLEKVNAFLKKEAPNFKLSPDTIKKISCGKKADGCFLGVYRGDMEEGKTFLELLKQAKLIPNTASVPKDEG